MTAPANFVQTPFQPQLYSDSIGTFGEKCLHRSIKYYIEPNSAYHEIRIGRFIADVFKDRAITEVQTGSFTPLAKKLPPLLEEYIVTVAMPISHKKQIIKVDGKSGEVLESRKSPKTGTFCDCFFELARIKPLLAHPHLSIHLLLVDMDEYRLATPKLQKIAGRRRRVSKIEQIPTAIIEEITLSTPQDFAALLPNFSAPFTVAELAKSAKISHACANSALYALRGAGAVERVGKRGNAYLYIKCSE